eukprot:gene3489-25021_t
MADMRKFEEEHGFRLTNANRRELFTEGLHGAFLSIAWENIVFHAWGGAFPSQTIGESVQNAAALVRAEIRACVPTVPMLMAPPSPLPMIEAPPVPHVAPLMETEQRLRRARADAVMVAEVWAEYEQRIERG